HRSLVTAAYYNLIAAAGATLPAVATGLLAWQWQYGGKRLKGNLRLHLVLGTSSTVLIWLLAGWRTRLRREPGRRLSAAYVALGLIAAAVVALTGHLGGILSGVETPSD